MPGGQHKLEQIGNAFLARLQQITKDNGYHTNAGLSAALEEGPDKDGIERYGATCYVYFQDADGEEHVRGRTRLSALFRFEAIAVYDENVSLPVQKLRMLNDLETAVLQQPEIRLNGLVKDVLMHHIELADSIQEGGEWVAAALECNVLYVAKHGDPTT